MAAVSPDGATIAIGSRTGSVLFVDAATGAASRGVGAHTAAVASTLYTPDGSTVVTVGDDGRMITWNLETHTETAAVSGAMGHVRNAAVSPDGSTLYTAGLGGELLAWDLTGTRSFGRSAHVGPGLPCCDPVDPPGPPLAVSPDGSLFAVPIAASTVGLFFR